MIARWLYFCIQVCDIMSALRGVSFALVVSVADTTQVAFTKTLDHRLNNSYSEQRALSAIECGAQCLNNGYCLSANYHGTSRTCELNENHVTDEGVTLLSSSGWTVLNLLSGTSPGGWIVHGVSEYKFVRLERTWNEAQFQCEAMDAYLAAVQSDDEHQFLVDQVEAMGEGFGQSLWWLGGSDALLEGVWIWTDGTPVLINRWIYGPNNLNGLQHCLSLFYHVASATYGWNDGRCNNAKYSVCERGL